jgi:radical SAM protein with 4Fe4S-binding SPASM domain
MIARLRREYPNMRIEAADCFTFAPAGLIRDEDWCGCQAGITSIGIDASGNVMPCLAMRAAAICGNVKETPLKEIWKNSPELDFNRRFNPGSVSGECRDCQILDYCRGGCGSFSLSYYGHFHEAPFCYFRAELRKGGN